MRWALGPFGRARAALARDSHSGDKASHRVACPRVAAGEEGVGVGRGEGLDEDERRRRRDRGDEPAGDERVKIAERLDAGREVVETPSRPIRRQTR